MKVNSPLSEVVGRKASCDTADQSALRGNLFLVHRCKAGIVLGDHTVLPMTTEEALNLAAWLVAVADPDGAVEVARAWHGRKDGEHTKFEKALLEAHETH